jgi:hypothetical protein
VTALRSLAVRVSHLVVRHASAGSREWAEGLAREVQFIESDWRAIVWALGSTRVLLERRSASAAQGKRRRPEVMDWSGWAWYGVLAFDFAIDAAVAKNWQVRAGSALVALGWAYFGTRSVTAWLREGDDPTDLAARELHARGLLVEKLARARTIWRWIPTVVIYAMYGGFLLAHLNPILSPWRQRLLMLLTVLASTILSEDTTAKIEARIRRLDERIARARQISSTPMRLYSDHWGRPPNLSND